MHRIANIDFLYYLETRTKPIKETTNQLPGSEFADSVSTIINREFDSNNTANGIQNNAMNDTPMVTVYIGIGVAILIVLTSLIIVVVVTLVLFYIRKSSQPKPKSDYDPYSTLCRGETQQPQPHSQHDLYDQIQLSPSTGQAEIASKAEIENISILLSHQTSDSSNTDIDQCNKISEQDNDIVTSEQPTYAAVKKKHKKSKIMKWRSHQNNTAAVEKNREKIISSSHSVLDKEDIKKNPTKQREPTPTFMHTTESPEALYSAVMKKPKADKEEQVPPPLSHSVEELYTAVKKNVQGSAMEEKEGPPHIPPHTIEDLYTAVMKKPKGDPTDTGTDGAPPIPPHTVDDC